MFFIKRNFDDGSILSMGKHVGNIYGVCVYFFNSLAFALFISYAVFAVDQTTLCLAIQDYSFIHCFILCEGVIT